MALAISPRPVAPCLRCVRACVLVVPVHASYLDHLSRLASWLALHAADARSRRSIGARQGSLFHQHLRLPNFSLRVRAGP
jgi:hypothetical protein